MQNTKGEPSRKIMFYINTLGRGGAERVILQLADRFSKEDCSSIVVTSFVCEDEYPVPDEVKRISLETKEIAQSRIKRNISRIRGLRSACKSEKPDVLISFMQEPNFRAILATRGLPVKTVVSVRNDPNREYAGRIGRIVGKLILPMADGCVFQTDDAKEWFPKRLQKKSQVIMNEVSEKFFNTVRKDPENIITVGRLTAQKNHKMLIRAFAQIASEYPEEKLLIYGEGDLRDTLECLIGELNLTDRVILMGNTSNVATALSKARVFVLSSDYEGMPNALLEALAVGVPSISTNCPCGGPKALIEHGKNGLLIPIGDGEALAKALDKLLSDEEYANKLGADAKDKSKQYMPQKIFENWKNYIYGIVK